MKKIVLIPLLLLAIMTIAQKKVVPVSQSALTGISLPSGSKQDKRFLSETSARMLLEMESKKTGMEIKDVEVIYLPPIVAGSYNDDSLITALSAIGWNISPVGTDDKYVLLQKDGKSVMAYYEKSTKKETQLYLGVTAAITSNAGNNGGYQNPQVYNNPPSGYPPPPPPVTNQQDYSNNNNNPPPPPPPAPPPPSSAPPMNMERTAPTPAGNNGITISTINFDDGWVSMPMADWVQVTKGEFTVLLHYPSHLPDNLQSEEYEVILKYYWNLLVQPRYTLSNIEIRKDNNYNYQREYFMESDAVETNTGKSCHVSFRIFLESGIASCVEIQSSSKNIYWASFPTIESINPLRSYNKFAVTQGDLVGEWQENIGSYANYYNVYTGGYAGMNAVSINSKMVLGDNGQFTIEHKGASGMAGSQQFFDEKHAGSYQVSNWEISMVETDGKQVVYHAYYEAVKNGRVLHMQHKQFSGSQMHLYKTK